jgi:hypothetical protein
MKTLPITVALLIAEITVAEDRPVGTWTSTNWVTRDGSECYAITTVTIGTNADFSILMSYLRTMDTPLILGTRTTGMITDWRTNQFTAIEEVWPEILHPGAKLIRKGEATCGFHREGDKLILWTDRGTTNTLFRQNEPEQDKDYWTNCPSFWKTLPST